MIALIRKDYGGMYATYVLAVLNKGRNKQVVAFTDDYGSVKRFPVWKMKRNVYVISGDIPREKNGPWIGYKRIVEDDALLKRIKKHPERADALGDEMRSLATPAPVVEWHEVKDMTDLYVMTSLACNFYKATITGCTRGDVTEFTIESKRNGTMSLRLSDITDDTLFEGDLAVTPNELIKMKKQDVDIFYRESGSFLFALNERCIQCDKMQWKMIPE